MKLSSTDKAAAVTAATFFALGCIEVQKDHARAGMLFLLGAVGCAVMIYAMHRPKGKK